MFRRDVPDTGGRPFKLRPVSERLMTSTYAGRIVVFEVLDCRHVYMIRKSPAGPLRRCYACADS